MSPRVDKRTGAQQREREGAQRLQLALSAGQLGDWSWNASTDRVTMGARTAECFGLAEGAHVTWTDLRERLAELTAVVASLATRKSPAARA